MFLRVSGAVFVERLNNWLRVRLRCTDHDLLPCLMFPYASGCFLTLRLWNMISNWRFRDKMFVAVLHFKLTYLSHPNNLYVLDESTISWVISPFLNDLPWTPCLWKAKTLSGRHTENISFLVFSLLELVWIKSIINNLRSKLLLNCLNENHDSILTYTIYVEVKFQFRELLLAIPKRSLRRDNFHNVIITD